MNKRQIVRTIMIFIAMLVLGSFSFATTATPTAAPKAPTLEEERTKLVDEAKKQAVDDGTYFGKLDGESAGRADQAAGKTSNYKNTIPTDETLIKMYNLAKDSSTYQNDFLAFYRLHYQFAYEAAFRQFNYDKVSLPVVNATEQGETLGTIQGQVSATIDLVQGKADSWIQAYSEYLAGGSLENRYWLTRESDSYKNKFMDAYVQGFMTGYIETYQATNVDNEVRNKNYKLVDMVETTLTFDDQYVHFDSGASSVETRTPLTLEFPAGALYQPTYFGTYKIQNSFNSNNSKYTPVSSKYVVSVSNAQGAAVLKKPITLSFEYFGSERAGIYQWKNNQWLYVFSTLKDGAITTEIPPGVYAGGEYAIFIDDTFKNTPDIGFTWAYKELYTLMRRDIIIDGIKFNPTASITKAHLAELIYMANGSNAPSTSNKLVISDLNALGGYYTAVEYVLNKGYMTLDAKLAFNPNKTITYADAEVIMSRVVFRNVKWSELASKMLVEKYAKSAGKTNIKAVMTKAEAAYMIHEWMK